MNCERPRASDRRGRCDFLQRPPLIGKLSCRPADADSGIKRRLAVWRAKLDRGQIDRCDGYRRTGGIQYKYSDCVLVNFRTNYQLTDCHKNERAIASWTWPHFVHD